MANFSWLQALGSLSNDPAVRAEQMNFLHQRVLPADWQEAVLRGYITPDGQPLNIPAPNLPQAGQGQWELNDTTFLDTHLHDTPGWKKTDQTYSDPIYGDYTYYDKPDKLDETFWNIAPYLPAAMFAGGVGAAYLAGGEGALAAGADGVLGTGGAAGADSAVGTLGTGIIDSGEVGLGSLGEAGAVGAGSGPGVSGVGTLGGAAGTLGTVGTAAASGAGGGLVDKFVTGVGSGIGSGALSALGALGSAAIGAVASNQAANAQTQAADKATDLQREIYNDQIARQQPFYQGGLSANDRMLFLLGLKGDAKAPGYGSLNKPFGMDDFEADPGYSFRLTEGLKALDRTAAARGGLLSGAALKGATRYGQDMASQEYGNAFNRFQVNRSNVLNPLQSLTGAAQTSANTMDTSGTNFANSAGSNIVGAGNARASGYIGVANAISGGIGQYVNQTNQNSMLERILANSRGNGYGFTGTNTFNPYGGG